MNKRKHKEIADKYKLERVKKSDMLIGNTLAKLSTCKLHPVKNKSDKRTHVLAVNQGSPIENNKNTSKALKKKIVE